MPLYEFHCEECNESAEKIVRPDTEESPCPTCGKLAKRIWSAPSPMVWGKGGRGF